MLKEEKKLQEIYPGYCGVDHDYIHAGKKSIENLLDWKFGVRIHWGIYSITGSGPESWPLNVGHNEPNGSPQFREQYEELYKFWNPSRFNADQWCELFSRAGLKFFVFTTKHHDGFSLYDTKSKIKKRMIHTGPDADKIVDCDLHYSIMEGPFKRDIVKELIIAGRKRNLGIGLYFSHIDWFDSDFRIDKWNYQQDLNYTKESDPDGFKRMISRHRKQIQELCTYYGNINLLSLDMGFPGGEEQQKHGIGIGTKHGVREDIIETIKMARRLQPKMLIRQRGIAPYGDYKTPERVVPEDPEMTEDLPWQVIYPGSKHFSHNWHDEYKPASWIIRNLIDITSKGGVFQVGYGPMPDGRWAPSIVRRLDEVGKWLKINGEGIYCTRPYKVYKEGENIRFTRSKDKKYVYIFILDYLKRPFISGNIRVESVKVRPGSNIKMLGLDYSFNYKQNSSSLIIEIPEWFNDHKLPKLPCNKPYTFKMEID